MMNFRLAATALALIAGGGLSLPAHAQSDEPALTGDAAAAVEDEPSPIQYELYYSTTGRYQVNNGNRTRPSDGDGTWNPTGENFGEWNNTFGGALTYDKFQLSLQADSALYIHPPRAAGNASALVRNQLTDRYENVLRLEFASLSYSGRMFDATLGDFYVTVGRGMLLSVRKVADVGIDNKLRGGEVRARLGPVTVHGFGGFLNVRNYEAGQAFFYPEVLPDSRCSEAAAALAVCPDGMDIIGGGRVEYRQGKYLKVGAHAVYIDVPDVLSRNPSLIGGDVRGYGGSIELPRPVKWLNAYIEGVRIEETADLDAASEGRTGQGVYGNMNLYLGRTTLLFEGKAYDNLFNVAPRGYWANQDGSQTPTRQSINRILEPPTAERPFTRIRSNVTVTGGRLRADYRVTPKFVPFISGGYFRDETVVGVKSDIFFGFGGFRWRWKGGEASVNAGYRTERRVADIRGAVQGVNDAARQIEQEQARVEQLEDQVRMNPTDPGLQMELTAARDDLDRATETGQAAVNNLQTTRELDGAAIRTDGHLRFDVSFDVGGPYSIELFGDNFYVIDPTFESEEFLEGRMSVSVRSRNGWSLTGAYEYYTGQPGTFEEHYPSLGGAWDFIEGGTVRFLVGGERAGLKCSGGVCRLFPGFEGGRVELVLRQ